MPLKLWFFTLVAKQNYYQFENIETVIEINYSNF